MANLDQELLRRILDAQSTAPSTPSQSQAITGATRGMDLANTILQNKQAQEDRVRVLKEKIDQAKLEDAKRREEQMQAQRVQAYAVDPRNAKLRAAADPMGEMKFIREVELQKIKDAADRTSTQKGANEPPKSTEFSKTRAETITSKVDQAIKKLGILTTGIGGQLLSKVGGTQARNLRGDLETIKANLGFQQLQEMREASKTGGALGQVAVQELEALQSAVASLDQAQDSAQLANNLNEIKTRYNNWLKAYEASRNEIPSNNQNMQPPAQTGFRIIGKR